MTSEVSVTLMPQGRILSARKGETLLSLLRREGIFVEAPCGGSGRCGKCKVLINGEPVSACRFLLETDVTVTLPQETENRILTESAVSASAVGGTDYAAAFDIGTTTVVCFLLDPEGRQIAVKSMHNPQSMFGADVVSRIRAAQSGHMAALTASIREGMNSLLLDCCHSCSLSPEDIRYISVVGNSCMQQLFLGLSTENLSAIPFRPVITDSSVTNAEEIFPRCPEAKLLTVPDISGYAGADTVACILAAGLYESDKTTLLVDIGTNGEMVLCHKGRMVACATAAGPALEGASISCGMRAAAGAIDHADLWSYSVLGGTQATGICGSGLVDAVAVMCRKGLLNFRGRILTSNHRFPLCPGISLTQEDIRQVQLAKGAIAAGIELMAQHLGIATAEIDSCLLAGAFGSFLDPENACRIGLLPQSLLGKIVPCGNLAGSGAKMLAAGPQFLPLCDRIVARTEYLELASVPAFQRTFAKCMQFQEEMP